MKKILTSLYFLFIAATSFSQSTNTIAGISYKCAFGLIPETAGSSAITNYKYILSNCAIWVAPSHTGSLPFLSDGLSICTFYEVKPHTLNNSCITDGYGAFSLPQAVSISLGNDLMAGNNPKTVLTATAFFWQQCKLVQATV